MSKVLFWVAVVLVVLVVMRIVARNAASRTQAPPAARSRTRTPKRFEAMVQCAHCGVHLPAADALKSHGKTWCSQEHARLGSRQ